MKYENILIFLGAHYAPLRKSIALPLKIQNFHFELHSYFRSFLMFPITLKTLWIFIIHRVFLLYIHYLYLYYFYSSFISLSLHYFYSVFIFYLYIIIAQYLFSISEYFQSFSDHSNNLCRISLSYSFSYCLSSYCQ